MAARPEAQGRMDARRRERMHELQLRLGLLKRERLGRCAKRELGGSRGEGVASDRQERRSVLDLELVEPVGTRRDGEGEMVASARHADIEQARPLEPFRFHRPPPFRTLRGGDVEADPLRLRPIGP